MESVLALTSIGLTGGLIVFLFWQARRAATASDGQLDATKQLAELGLQYQARGTAIEQRDAVIAALEADAKRQTAAIAELIKQRDATPIKDPHAAVDAIRDALLPDRPVGGLLPVPSLEDDPSTSG